MAPGGTAIAARGHAHAQAVIAGVQFTIDRSQMFEWSVMNWRVAWPQDDADAHRAFAAEFAMRAACYLPEAAHAACHDVVVRPAQ